MENFANPPYTFTPEAIQLVGEARLAYVRKVYSYFSIAVASAIAGTMIAMESGLAFSFAHSPIIGMIVFFGSIWFASKSANNPSRAVPTLSVATFVSGLFVAPMLYAIAHGYIRGTSTSTIYDALILSGSIFAGLTLYTFVSKKDFSYLGASLSIGLFMLIGIMFVNFFVQSTTLDLGLSVIGVVIFSGFILVDTSRILRRAHEVPPTLAALSLYLDFLNLFMMILRLLGAGGRDRR
ncbi:MAG: Bax inhibitor-1/YccA family protein [Bacteroidota bacterium]|nr:Bax inhibitor-1/YccA family protein [Bacteroidota bacterium]MDP4242455.1 Bax inhibitor-1/YccA family protein [Bacteroidota bacterium]MDP4289043.1 Bax inhibitor-1/YccA family protein [Bacteroidota bacterium]